MAAIRQHAENATAVPGTTVPRRLPAMRTRRRVRTDIPYINRELSWIEFNERVLHEAVDEHNPLLERVRFLAIFASNLDEFFQIRVAGLKQQLAAGRSNPTPDGMSAAQTLDAIRTRLLPMVEQHSTTWAQARQQLAEEQIRIVRYEERPERHVEMRARFFDEIFPVLTPLAVDPGHPFPYISDLSLSLAVTVRDPVTDERLFARIKVPPVLPRLMEVGEQTYVLLEQVIAANLDALFPGMEVLEHHLFRVTRNADLALEEEEAPDLLEAIEEELRKRRFGNVVRLEIERSMPHTTRTLLMRGLNVEAPDVYEISGMLDLNALHAIADLDVSALHYPAWQPVVPLRLLPTDPDEEADVFAAMRAGDILLHHPYESFAASVQRFVEQAAEDPDVLTIKQTLYRTSGDSPIVRALIEAAEAGKQVVVLVELKARFDEAANIVWARALERAGAHVAYGVMGLKTHSKVALVVRREGRGLRRYVHIGTGNYNNKTARGYVDLGLLTCDTDLGADVTDLFNVLTGHSRQTRYRKLMVAPAMLRAGLIEMIDGERQRHEEFGDGRIVIKCNALVDPASIAALYRASAAGVPIDIIVRGMCSVRPGVPGVSETVNVRSVVGRYLEHSRIFMFGRGERERFFIGSADLMERNLDRRVEALAPVSDAESQARLRTILEVMLADDRRAWQLGNDDRWRRVDEMTSEPRGVDTFETFMNLSPLHERWVTAANNEEIELKFSFTNGEALKDWLDHTFPVDAAGDDWRTHQITDRYFDTPDEALKDAGFGARLRTVGADTLVTLKANLEVGDGLHRRLELEAPATRALNPFKWPDSEARAQLIDVAGARRLIERFAIGQQRRERAITFNGSTAMASLDEGEVEYLGIAAGELRHFEVELHDGDSAALRALARRVAASGLAKAEDRSKLELATDMVEQAGRVAPDDAWADAARKLLRRHLIRMLERESATRAGDVLALKQMRVATRRMRATWRVFGTAFAGRHARDFDISLRRVAGLLGAVRDLDVLLETVEKRDEVATMRTGWRVRRDAAFDELMRDLDSPDYEDFVGDFLEGTSARTFWALGKHGHLTIAERGPDSLERARQQMLEAAAIAAGSNEAVAWHNLRIAAKRMRYSLEAFRDVLDERATTDFIERLRSIQDNLGEMNDASIAAREAATWLTSLAGADAPPAERVAVARYIGQSEGAVARARTDFAALWQPLAESAVPAIAANATSRARAAS